MAIAAGSGITPVIAIARTLLAANPETRFDLIYANKAAMDVMFLEELADLKDKYPQRLAIHHVLSREQRIAPLLTGRIDAEKLQALLGTAIHADDVDEWFLCGPFELVQLCRDTLAERGVKPENVRFELFTSGKPDRPEGNAGRPVVVDESQGDVQDHVQAGRPAGRGGQPHPCPRIHPERGAAGAPGRAVRVCRGSLRHLPRQGGHRHRDHGRELRAGAGRAGQGLRADLPVATPPARKSPSTSTSKSFQLQRRSSMISLSISNGIAEIVLNAPHKLNSLDEQALRDLTQAYDDAAAAASRGEVRALLLRGEGRAFCAGRDIAGVTPETDDAAAYLGGLVEPLLKKMAAFPAPTFAAAHGACLGVGLGLLLATDVVYVAENAKFGSPFAKLGATLDSGGHWYFTERLGMHRTLDLIYTADLISGAEAVAQGMFSRAMPADSLLESTREIVVAGGCRCHRGLHGVQGTGGAHPRPAPGPVGVHGRRRTPSRPGCARPTTTPRASGRSRRSGSRRSPAGD